MDFDSENPPVSYNDVLTLLLDSEATMQVQQDFRDYSHTELAEYTRKLNEQWQTEMEEDMGINKPMTTEEFDQYREEYGVV